MVRYFIVNVFVYYVLEFLSLTTALKQHDRNVQGVPIWILSNEIAETTKYRTSETNETFNKSFFALLMFQIRAFSNPPRISVIFRYLSK